LEKTKEECHKLKLELTKTQNEALAASSVGIYLFLFHVSHSHFISFSLFQISPAELEELKIKINEYEVIVEEQKEQQA
jgi:hypothetical protein